MRAPWTVLRDANAELRRERDERAELIALRKERIALRTMCVTGYVALLGLSVHWNAGPDRRTEGGILLLVLCGVLVAGGVARLVALLRHGESESPEAKRAEATRTLFTLPLVVVVAVAIQWYLGSDPVTWVTFAVVLGAVGTAGLLARRRWYAAQAREQAVAAED